MIDRVKITKIVINAIFITFLGMSMFWWFKESRFAFIIGFLVGIIITSAYFTIYYDEIKIQAEIMEDNIKSGKNKYIK